jgi:hypothetical protein
LRHRRLLVGTVVVHVHAWMPRKALVHEIDEGLEQMALLDPIVGPRRAVVPVGALVQE